jgi:hypothetical protein
VPLADPAALVLLAIWILAAIGLRTMMGMRQPGVAAILVLPWAASLTTASALVTELGPFSIVTSVVLMTSALIVILIPHAGPDAELDPPNPGPLAWLTDHGVGLGLRSSHGHG